MASSRQDFQRMDYPQLHRELKKMLAQAQRVITWFDSAERKNLLPALQAMHDLVAQPGRREPDPSKPNWADECQILGITPEMVRQWKSRTATETDIRRLVGEEPTQPRRSPQDRNREAVQTLQRLAQAVLEGKDEDAEHIAQFAAERYGF
jgi:hypothetical protein